MPKLAKISSKQRTLRLSGRKYQRIKSEMFNSDQHTFTDMQKVVAKLIEKVISEVKPMEGIEKEFSCSNCFGFLYHPATAPCGHSFCARCSRAQMYCSHCQKSVKPSSLSRLNITLNTAIEHWYPKENSIHTLLSEGDSLLENRSFSEAESKYTEVLNKDPDRIYAICQRATARKEANKWDLVLADVVLIKIKTNNPFKLSKQLHREEYSKIQSYEKVIVQKVVEVFLDSVPHFDKPCYSSPSEQIGDSLDHMDHYPPFWSAPDLSVFVSPIINEDETVKADFTSGAKSDFEETLDSIISSTISNLLTHLGEGSCKDSLCTESETSVQPEINENSMDDTDFCCILCTRLFYEPLCTPCGHTFCLECLERCFDHRTECPMCKNPLAKIYHHQKYLSSVDWSLDSIIKRYLPKKCNERENLRADERKKLKKSIPLFVCAVAYPSVRCGLHIFEPRYRLMLRRTQKIHDGKFAMTAHSKSPEMNKVGTVLDIEKVSFLDDGRSIITSMGTKRFEIIEYDTCDGYYTVKVEYIVDEPEKDVLEAEGTQNIANMVYKRARVWYERSTANFKRIVETRYGKFPEQDFTKGDNGPDWMWWILAMFPVEDDIKLTILAKRRLRERLAMLNFILKKLEKTRTEAGEQSKIL